MRLQRMWTKIIFFGLVGFIGFMFMISSELFKEEKPHFVSKNNLRPQIVELEKLPPGEKIPVFKPINKTNKQSDITKITIPNKIYLKKQNLVDDKKSEKALRDELPLFQPDENCRDAYSSFQIESYCLPHHNIGDYFNRFQTWCLMEGTRHVIKNGTECLCKAGWYGSYCSMPRVVYTSEYPRDTYAHLPADPPRRIINTFPFTQEFHLLETRFAEYGDTVDLYVICESNYTAAGHPRKRLLLERLQAGYLKEYQHKILYVPLGYYPKKAQYNGWVADGILRNHITDAGLPRIKNLKENDVIVLNDADELPTREALLFLKLHRGYPEPIGFHLVHNVYGFYWIGDDHMSHAFGACSVAMLLHFFNWELYRLRSASAQLKDNRADLDHFRYMHGGAVREWSLGNRGTMTPAGWHCSWCFKAAGIQTKLLGAHWSDLPRWGAFPQKTTLDYIHNLTVRGMWFDDRTHLLPAPSERDDWFAPKYLKKRINEEEFAYLLRRPGDENIPTPTSGKHVSSAFNQTVQNVGGNVKATYHINQTAGAVQEGSLEIHLRQENKP